MPKVTGRRKERRHIQLTKGLWTKLTELYSPRGITNSHVIDSLISMHLRRLEEEVAQAKEGITLDDK